MLSRILLGVAALILLLAVAIGGATGFRYLAFGEKAIGVVVALGEDGGTIHPVVEFATQSGETRQYKGLGSSEPDYYVGQRVAIRYFQDDLTATLISNSFQELWLAAVSVAIIGLILAAIALVMRRMDPPRRQQKRMEPPRRQQKRADRPGRRQGRE